MSKFTRLKWYLVSSIQIYYWGKIKTSGDNQMYPKAYMDLSGWSVRTFSCGANTFAVTSETSTVTWGGAQASPSKRQSH